MKKRVFAAATAAMMTVSALGSVTAGAFEQTSYAEDVSVYVNGQKIDNGQYKPIIANDRTLVRLVPIFEALGYSNSYDSNAKTVTFAKGGGTVSYKFTAENYTAETISDGQAESTYELDVPATLQYSDVFYVPLRAFCDMVGLNITWDNATRSVYVESSLLTYEQAKEKAAEFVNDSDVLLGGDTATVEHNGRQAYAFVLRSKELVENGGSGTMGTTIYVYADNGEVDGSNGNANISENTAVRFMNGDPGQRVSKGVIYCVAGYDVNSAKKAMTGEYLNNNITIDDVAEFSKNNHSIEATNNGITVQKALDLIKAAYKVEDISATAEVYTDCVVILTPNADEYKSYGISDDGKGKYYVTASSVENIVKNGNDSNSTVRILDEYYNIVGGAN